MIYKVGFQIIYWHQVDSNPAIWRRSLHVGRTPNALPGCWEDVKLMSHTSKMGVEQNLCKDMPLLCTCQKTIVSKTSTNTITKQFCSLTSKFKWTLNNNRIEKIILIPNVVTIFFFFFFFFFFWGFSSTSWTLSEDTILCNITEN